MKKAASRALDWLTLQPWRWRWCVPPNCRLSFNRLHTALYLRKYSSIIIAVKTSNPVQCTITCQITSYDICSLSDFQHTQTTETEIHFPHNIKMCITYRKNFVQTKRAVNEFQFSMIFSDSKMKMYGSECYKIISLESLFEILLALINI
jgi:hypothetical protein